MIRHVKIRDILLGKALANWSWLALETVTKGSLIWPLSLSPTPASSQNVEWFGIGASLSWASLETCVIMGRLFGIVSALTRAVLSASLATTLISSTDFEVFFVHCSSLPDLSPKRGAHGGWKFYSIFFGTQNVCIVTLSSCLRHFHGLLLSPIIALYSLIP